MSARTPRAPSLGDEVAQALTSSGVPAEVGVRGVRVGGRWWRPVGLVHPSVGEASVHAGAGVAIIADRLSAVVRDAVARAGGAWVDRRGELRFPGRPPVAATFEATVSAPQRVVEVFTATGLDVVVAMLGAPDHPWGVQELARATGRSAGRVSELLGGLRSEGLVDRSGRPLVPELFWEAAGAWKPRWRPISALPSPGPGVVVGGWRGAVAWGAPVLVTGDAPLELYVPDRRRLDHLVLERPDGGDDRRHVVAVCPSPLVARRSGEHAPHVERFSTAALVAVALDLAQDRGRGREALEGWEPSGGGRVW